MQLALNLGYHVGRGAAADHLVLAREAERLGFSSVWIAEAYGSDAPTALGWLAGQTSTIGLGSAIMQIPARTPAMTAMTAATLDVLSHGRFRLGLGVSGPQVSEGWHGVRFAQPLARTREYLEVVRLALSRERVVHDGAHYRLPLPDGPGKALHLSLHPVRDELPIYLAAVGPKNLELAGEIADGWLATFFAPDYAAEQLTLIEAGRLRAGRKLAGFDVVPTVPVAIGDDVESCAQAVRPYAALYVGGMGSRQQNFYNELAVRMGYRAEAAQVRELYLSGRKLAAAAAVPLRLIDDTSLLGPPERITERLRAFAAAGVTTLAVGLLGRNVEAGLRTLRLLAEAFDRSATAG
jgi:F420-dependent oxidoreductase-like protein